MKNIGKKNISKFGKKNIDTKKNIISFTEAASQTMFKQSKNDNKDNINFFLILFLIDFLNIFLSDITLII